MNFKKQEQLYIHLLNDELFLQWILFPSRELTEHWYHIMQNDSQKARTAENLKQIIRSIEVEEKGLSPEAKEAIWKNIQNSDHYVWERKFKLSSFLKYAAVFLLLISVPICYYIFHRSQDSQEIDYQAVISETPVPDNITDNVLLVLGNNEKIEIKEKNVELIHDSKGRTHINSEVIENSHKEHAAPELNQLYVPYGKTTNIMLSDGSRVWVNSGSRIIYPSSFSGNKREIFIEGEAYLEVSRNEEKPFIVKTGILEVNVMGTSFNVSAYKNDAYQSVVLVSGKVSVKETNKKNGTEIKPNQEYMHLKDAGIYRLKEVDVLDHIGWKYGFIAFRNEPLSNVLRKVERYYNIPIEYKIRDTDQTSISGKLDLKENIEETFRTIAITAPIEYSVRDSVVIVEVKH